MLTIVLVTRFSPILPVPRFAVECHHNPINCKSVMRRNMERYMWWYGKINFRPTPTHRTFAVYDVVLYQLESKFTRRSVKQCPPCSRVSSKCRAVNYLYRLWLSNDCLPFLHHARYRQSTWVVGDPERIRNATVKLFWCESTGSRPKQHSSISQERWLAPLFSVGERVMR